MLVELGDEFGRHAHGLLVLAAREAHERGLVRVVWQRLRPRFEAVEQAADLGVGQSLVADAGQQRELATTGLGAASGHVGGLVPAEHGGGHGHVEDVHQPRLELLERIVHG